MSIAGFFAFGAHFVAGFFSASGFRLFDLRALERTGSELFLAIRGPTCDISWSTFSVRACDLLKGMGLRFGDSCWNGEVR